MELEALGNDGAGIQVAGDDKCRSQTDRRRKALMVVAVGREAHVDHLVTDNGKAAY